MAKAKTVADAFVDERNLIEKIGQVVVGYKDDWYFTSHIGLPNSELYKIIDQRAGRVDTEVAQFNKIPVEDLNLQLFRLGYVQLDTTLYYVARQPVRKTKYGISSHNLEFFPVGTLPNGPMSKGDLFSQAVRSGELRKTLRGEYKSLAQALVEINKHLNPVPFSRDFAVWRTSLKSASLMYKTRSIGELSLDDDVVNLYPSSWHMLERVSELEGIPKVIRYGEE